ncbi:MAG: rRNA pseudouridine synthase [Lachnospiraceae bacterium]|nr:rRNA pseudouridine synthase [Lachnospiraceae bacterium]
MIRIDKYLADCGIGTRSEVKKYIKAKQITVNGALVSKPEEKVDETKDDICFKGHSITYEKYVYYLFHKPAGCVTAKQDNVHQTVMDYFPEDIRAKDIAPVGRLDLDTEGLLLLTNDGPLTHHLLSPAHHIPKTYYAILDKEVPEDAVEKFKDGVDIGDDKLTLPAELVILMVSKDEAGKKMYSAELTIHEGRFHQVKRMFEAVGCTVTYLKRLSMGSLTLGNLSKGEYRKLTADEIAALQK